MANNPADIADALRSAHQHHQEGRLQQAEQLYRSILNADPEHAEANHLLGVLAYQSGNLDVAGQLIAKAVLNDVSKPAYLNSLGRVLEAQRRLDEALSVYQHAITLDPDFTQALVNSGVVLEALGRLDEALDAYDKALETNSDSADAHNSRGLVLLALGRLGEALESFQQALNLDPDFAEAYNNRGNALQAQGRITEALYAYRQAIAIKPDFSGAHSNLLLCLNYDADKDAPSIAAAHRQWGTRHAARLERGAVPNENVPDPARRLRVGYVSPDFCNHPVAAFIEPLLAAHDRETIDVFCYANIVRPDETTERLRKLAGTWRSIRGMSDERVAELVREDSIDILVDLAGHTAGNRLLVFARKPAPIQVTYLGYPGTSGLSVMDYRLTDSWTDPPESADELYTEKLVRLPDGCLCFQPPLSGPDVAPLPELSPGNITFVSFNNAAKVSPAAVSLWTQVLQAVPNAGLMLKSKSYGDRKTVERLATLLVSQGISGDRLDFVSWLPASDEHLALYNRAHIALDTFPYSGCTTTCEALWMGVPVITLARDEPRSRMSLSVMKQVGLDEFIAESPEAYIDIARDLATDIGKLQTVRLGLRERMKQSSLLDAASFARSVEAAYRDMWQRYSSRT